MQLCVDISKEPSRASRKKSIVKQSQNLPWMECNYKKNSGSRLGLLRQALYMLYHL